MLSSPFTFPCGLTVPNRIAKSSMTERMADPAGMPSPRLARLFQRYADGGAGFLLTGNVVVDGAHLEGFGNAILEDGRHLDAFQAWAAAGRSRGAAMVMQLNHPGRQAMRSVTQQPVAPSAVGLPNTRFFAVPQALSEAGVRGVIDAFVRSAVLAERAGFSGVELHAAHGYLLSQFLSPHVNRRTDQWGGSVANRARVIVEIVERIRARVPASFAVGIKLNAGDFVKGGMSPEEATQVMRLLDPLGLDFIEVSGGTFERPASFGHGLPESTLRREGYFLEMARRARDATRVPLIVTGGLRSAAAMQQALADGNCDLVGLARPLALEPRLPQRLMADPGARAISVPLRLPKGPIAPLAELWWHHEQMERLASGGEPKLSASPKLALLRMTLRDRLLAWRRKRHLARQSALRQLSTDSA